MTDADHRYLAGRLIAAAISEEDMETKRACLRAARRHLREIGSGPAYYAEPPRVQGGPPRYAGSRGSVPAMGIF